MSIQSIQRKLNDILRNAPHKFPKLDEWLNTYLNFIPNEGTNIERRIPNIRRGQILFVDFGYNVLSEFRYKHYCVALNNSPRLNPKVTVIPITSKEHPHQLAINYELADRLEDIIRDKERSNFWKPFRRVSAELIGRGFKSIAPAIGSYDTVYPNCTAFINNAKAILPRDDKELQSFLDGILKSLEDFDKFYKASPSLLKSSYLRIEDITTISKARIIMPRSSNHPLFQLRLSDETLDQLDQAIIHRFTNSN